MRAGLFFILILGVVSLSSFDKVKKDSNIGGVIKLEGSFYSKKFGDISELSVEVVNLHNNEIEEILLVKSKAKLDLKLGYKYMVYIKKKGFATKKILVDAREAIRGNYKFHFDMELHKLDEKFNTSDFRPVCVLKYNRLKQKFVYDSNYTALAKSDLELEVLSKR